jgi:hypothetical protein
MKRESLVVATKLYQLADPDTTEDVSV